MASNRITYNIGFTTDTSGLSKAKKALQEIQNMTTADVSGLNFSNARQELEDIQHSAKQLEGALDNAFNAKLGTVNLQRLNSELNKLDLNTISNNMSKLGAQGQAAFRNIATQALTAKAEVKQTNVLLTKMKDTLGRTLSWSLSSAVINRFVGGIQQAIGYVKNLDTSLNNIRIVTGASADEMERFAERANDAARNMGAATTDYTNAALIYYQQGLGDEEVEVRTDVTVKTANVTQQSAEQVSEHLTAVWNGYKVSAEEAELYVDKLSAVAATTAADLGGLSTGMSKVASAANTMGVDADQLNAQLATIISVTRQAPESVGTALKTIYARMGDLQVEGGTDEFGVSLGDVSGTLKEAGIEVLDVKGNLRDMGTVIEEVGSKWNTWTEAQKNAISIAIAGKRQYNNLFALFENWDMYTNTLNVSKNSMGALQEQQDTYMESTEAHLQQMRTAAEGLYDSVLDESAIITLADVGKELLVFFENWVDGLGGGLSILNMALPILIRIFSGEIATGLQKFVSNLGVGARNARELAAEQEIIAKFGTQAANDKALQNLINIKKQFLQYDSVLSKEEKERVSEIIKQTNELQNQKAVYQEMIDKANQFTQREYGKNADQLIEDDEVPDLQSRVKAAKQIQQSGGVGGEAFPASATEAYYQSLRNVTGATRELVNANEELNSKNFKAQELYNETRAGVETQLNQKKLQIELLKEERSLLDPTSEEYKDITEKIKQYGQEVAILEEKKQKIIRTADKETAEYKEQKKTYQSLKQALEETGRTFIEYRDRQNATQKGSKAVTDALKNQYQELQKNKDVIGQVKFDKLTQEYQELLHALNSGNPADIFNPNGQVFTNLENFRIHINQAFDDVVVNGGTAVRVLREDIPSAMSSATNSANTLDQLRETLLNDAKWRDTAKSVTDLVGAVGQYASSVQSLIRLPSIWTNKDLTVGEKWLQTVQNVAFSAPMLINSIKAIGQSISKLSGLQSKSAEIILRSSDLLRAARAKNILTEEQYTLAVQLQTGAIDRNNLTEAQQNTLTGINTALTNVNTASLNANATAWQRLTGAIAANPIGAVVTAIMVVVTLIPMITSFLDSLEKKQRKVSEEIVENNNKIIESNKQIKDSLNDWDEVYKQYQEGTASAEELSSAIDTIADSMSASEAAQIRHSETIAKITGIYDELNEAIQRVKKSSEEEEYNALKSNQEEQASLGLSAFEDRVNDGLNGIELPGFMRNNWQINFKKEYLDQIESLFSEESLQTTFNPLLDDGTTLFIDLYDSKAFKEATDQQKSQMILELRSIFEAMQSEYEVGSEKYNILGQVINGINTDFADYIETTKQLFEIDAKNLADGIDDAAITAESSYQDILNYRDKFAKALQDSDPTLTEENAKAKAEELLLQRFPDLASLQNYAYGYEDKAKEILEDVNNKILYKRAKGNQQEYEELQRSDEKLLEQDDILKIYQAAEEKGILGFLNLEQVSTETWERISNETEINAQHINDIINEGLDFSRVAESADGALSSIQSIKTELAKDDFSGEDLANNEVWQALQSNLTAISTIYPNLQSQAELLSQTHLAGTERWQEALDAVENTYREIQTLGMEQSINETATDLTSALYNSIYGIPHIDSDAGIIYEKVPIEAVLADETFYEDMKTLLEQDYNLTIQAGVELDLKMDEIVKASNELQDFTSKIQEGYKITVDDIEAIGKALPGVLDGMEILSDGTVQLNQTAVKSAVATAKAEIEAKRATIKEDYEKRKKELTDKIADYQKMLKGYQDYTEGKMDIDTEGAEFADLLNQYVKDMAAKTANKELEINSAYINKVAAGYTDQLSNYEDFTNEMVRANAAMYEAWDKNEEAYQNGIGKYTIKSEYTRNYTPKESTPDSVEGTSPAKEDKKKTVSEDIQDLLKEAFDNAENIESIIEASIQGLQKELNDLEAEYLAQEAQWAETDYVLSNIGKTTSETAESTEDLADSTKDATDATKDAADAASKLVDVLNEEIDAYHNINIAITQLETSLSRLQEQQAKLTGNKLISNLNAQLDILEKQKAAYAEKIKIAQMEANVNRTRLAKEGATFNDDGTISNYSDLLLAKQDYVNKIIEKYNRMSAEEQEGYESTLEAAKEEYEKVKEAIEKYDSLITEEIPGLQDSIQSAFNQQIEIQIEAFKLKVDLTLSTNEAEREWNTFVDKVINNISEEDTLGNALTKKLNLDTYYNMDREGSIQALTSQLNDTLYEINQIQTLGFSSVFGDNIAAAEEYAEELRQQLMTALEEEKDLVDEIKAAYLEMIDQANEGLQEQKEQYEYISELIEHDQALIELLYGDKAYNKMSHYYTLQNENNKAQLAFYKQQADLWKERMDREEEGTEAWKKYKENWQESVSSMNDILETSIQGIIDEYTNTINIIFEQLGDKVTGGAGLESVKEEWELINDAAEDYLDDINAAYEIQKFQNTLQQAIDNTDSLDAQQTLTNLMNEQLSILEKKDKITQYDLDRANALYDVEVKRIALQEAQQNKSKMRLRRDSQGNYSYQFVSDEDQVAQAAQELTEAQNSLYNLDKDAYKNNLDQIQEIYSEWSEKLQEIISDTTLSYEEKQAEMVRLTQYYGDRLQNVAEQNASIRLNLEDSVFQALADMYDTNVETFYNMSQEEKDILMSDMVPGWNDGIQEMIDKIMAEGGLASASTEAFEEIEQATEGFNDQLEELEDIAEVSFDELSQGLDDCIEMNKDLLDSNEDLIDSWETQLSLIQDTVDSITLLTNVWDANKQAAIDAARAAWNYKKTQEIDVEGKGGSTGGGTSDNGGSSNGGNKGSNNGGGGGGNSSTNSDNGGSSSGLNTKKDDWGEDKYPAIGDKVTYLGDTYYSSSDGARPLGNRGAGENKEVAVTYLNPGAEYPVHVESTDAAYGWLKKYQIAKMDTGGYTGDWNSVEGKVAVLHEKELVLNKNDTSNILQAVRSIRAFAESNNRTPNTQIGVKDIFESIQDNLFTKVATMMTSLEMGGLGADFEKALSQINDQTVHQDVHIDATFPNVQSSSEIENALMNLTNVASQYSFNTRR